MFQPGDRFLLTWTVGNPAEEITADQFIILDVWGRFFFWPGWQETLDFLRETFPPRSTSEEVILDFEWPDGAGSADGLIFWGALLDTAHSEVYGTVHQIPFGYRQP
jgi:hypothetical protein